MKISEYISEEVARQGHNIHAVDGAIRVGWMTQAWEWAQAESKSSRLPTVSHIREIGRMIEPIKNDPERSLNGFRSVGVRVGDRICCRPEDVLPRLLHLWEFLDSIPGLGAVGALTFYKEFELIHPFVDGNGRTGKILLNWLTGTLDAPVFPPDDLWGEPIRNP